MQYPFKTFKIVKDLSVAHGPVFIDLQSNVVTYFEIWLSICYSDCVTTRLKIKIFLGNTIYILLSPQPQPNFSLGLSWLYF